MNPPTDPQADSQASAYDELYDLNKVIRERYHRNLVEILKEPNHKVTRYLMGRGVTPLDVTTWQLGYAPADWRFMTDRMVELAAFNLAVDLGVCVTDGGRNRDFFHDRLLSPRHNESGKVVGFSGRTIGEALGKDGSKLPKYLNTRETVLFHKKEVLFGLHKAAKEIKRTRHITLTEGDFDVISLHSAGVVDAVAKGGTALSDEHVKILIRLASKVTLVYDEDLNGAGQLALQNDLDRLLHEGLRVRVFKLPQPEPTHMDEFGVQPVGLNEAVKVDADSWVQQYYMPGRPKLAERLKTAEDGFGLTAKKLLSTEDIDQKVEGLSHVLKLLSKVQDGLLQSEYQKQLIKTYDLEKKQVIKQLAELKKPKKKALEGSEDEEEEDDDLPEWVDRKEFFGWGFAPRLVDQNKSKTGYYFSSGLKGLDSKPLTNFIIKPLYHIKDRGNVRRLVEINNGVLRKIIEVNSKFLLTLPAFEEMLSDLGHFVVDVGFERKHLKRISNFILDQTPEVYPVKTLGYQPEGFFAFSNAVFNGHLETYNQHGVVKVEDRHYFSPALSPVFDNYRQDGDDPYKYDKYLSYHKAPVGFSEWSRQLRKVYGDRAMVGSVFAVVSLFKDVVRQYSKIPLLYCYGPKDSGKSQFAESLMYLFFSGKDTDGKLISSLNLGSSPTTSAFWTAMSRFRNCPYVFNEFDDEKIERWIFTAFKSAWDGEGRTRQSKEDKHLTEEQAVHCAPVLVGQYLSTRDDGSVTSRSLVFEFANRKDTPFTPEETANFDTLKDWQRAGLNGILTEILPHRPVVVEKFKTHVRAIKDELTAMLEKQNQRSTPRTLENVSCLLAMYDTLEGLIDWPMSRKELWDYCRVMIGQMASLMQESDALAGFWSMLEYLLDRGDLIEGWDFKFETRLDVKVKVATGQKEEIKFDKPTKLLFLRMLNVHKPYAEYTRKQSSEQPHRQQTLEIYIRQQGYYVGETTGAYFSKKNGQHTSTNAFVLSYDMLAERAGVNLERFEAEPETKPTVTLTGSVIGEVKPLPSPKVLEFRLQVTRQGEGGIEQFNLKCFTSATELASQMAEGTYWQVSGTISEKRWENNGQTHYARSMDVQQITAVSPPPLFADGFNHLNDSKPGPF